MAKMTTLGMERFLNSQNDSLFSGIVLHEDINKTILTDNILLESAEFETVYADPYFLKDAINLFFRKWQTTFDRWVETLTEEYDPLHNYDGLEEIENIYGAQKSTNVIGEVNGQNTWGATETKNNYGAIQSGSTTNPIENTTTDQTSAFNSGDWQNENKQINSQGTVTTNSNTQAREDKNTSKEHTDTQKVNEHTDTNTKDTYTDKFTIKKGGNMGTTKTQDMLKDEISTRRANNIYKLITDVFLEEFCIMIYI